MACTNTLRKAIAGYKTATGLICRYKMKIALPSTTPDLSGQIETKLGNASYLLVIETGDMTFETAKGPPPSSGPGAGIQALTTVLEMGAEAVLVDHLSPHIRAALEAKNIIVINNVRGQIQEVIATFLQAKRTADVTKQIEKEKPSSHTSWEEALKKSGRQVLSFLPMLFGVILLLGLFQSFVPDKLLLSLFSGSTLQDALLGTFLGSILAGNPINSYVIGHDLFKAGVGLSAITALMIAWVTVGIIQIPAESAALGMKFTLVRNAAALLMAFATAIILTFLMELFI